MHGAAHMPDAHRRLATSVLATAVLLTGCDALFVELGRGQIAQVLVERTFPTGLAPYEDCPSLMLEYGGTGAAGGAITIAPLSRGCLLNVRLDGAILLTQSTMRLWSEQLAGYDMSALISIDVIIDEILVDGGRSFPLGADEVQSMSIALDDRVMLDQDDVLIPRGEEDELRIPVPQSLVDSFITALDEQVAFTSKLEVRIVLRDGVPIPRVLHVRAMLQPVLLVDGWNATF